MKNKSKQILEDALSQLDIRFVTRFKVLVGVCDILDCNNDAFSKVQGCYICNKHLQQLEQTQRKEDK